MYIQHGLCSLRITHLTFHTSVVVVMSVVVIMAVAMSVVRQDQGAECQDQQHSHVALHLRQESKQSRSSGSKKGVTPLSVRLIATAA